MSAVPRDRPPQDPAAVVRTARALLSDKKHGRHYDLGFDSFLEYAASLGHEAQAARDLLDLARVLAALPDLVAPVETAVVSLESARALAPLARDPAVTALPPGAERPLPPEEAVPRWVEAARSLSPRALRSEVDRAVERVRVWPEPLVPLEFTLDDDQLAELERARRLASEIHERNISLSEFLEIATRSFLADHDRD